MLENCKAFFDVVDQERYRKEVFGICRYKARNHAEENFGQTNIIILCRKNRRDTFCLLFTGERTFPVIKFFKGVVHGLEERIERQRFFEIIIESGSPAFFDLKKAGPSGNGIDDGHRFSLANLPA